MASTLVVAEPGCTHEGDYGTLRRLAQAAAEAGANVFKPQWTSDPVQMCERRHIGPDHPKRAEYRRAYGWLAFPVTWHRDLRAWCRRLGMQYACTAFLPQDVPVLAPFLDYLKVSSFEATDRELLRAALLAMPSAPEAGVRHPAVIVSTGMMEEEVDYRLWDHGQCFHPWAVLHCVSAYPAPLAAMNLGVISGNGRHGGESAYTGLSDHSRYVLTGALAVACGATVVEAHLRLDECSPSNPDYAAAFPPQQFLQYVRYIRDAEIMVGDGRKRRQLCEAWAVPYQVRT